MLPNIGLGELTVIVLVALLVFGPKRLPEMMRAAGKALGKLQRESQSAMKELRNATDFTGDLGTPPTLGAFDAPDTAPAAVAPVAADPGVPIQGHVEAPAKPPRPRGASPTNPATKGPTRKAATKRPTRKAATKKPATRKRATKAASKPKPAGAAAEPFEDT